MTRIINFTLPGRPATKKNSSILNLRGPHPVKLPSKAYSAWNRMAQLWLAKFRASCKVPLPLTGPLNCRAMFYQDVDRADAVNLYQALADTLQEGRIIENDSQIRAWDGSRLFVDAKEPRVEVVLESYVP